jgi:cell division protein FtsZ
MNKKITSSHKKNHKVSRRNYAEEKFKPLSANVKVIGVGGGGGNAVSRMAKNFTRGVDFVAINTDHQDLDQCNVKRKLYIGKTLTKGLGTGMNPDLGRQAAEENKSELIDLVSNADLVFLTAGLGGGTGTGVMPVIAEVAKQAGALTIAVVTKPFSFEGTQRERIAQEGLMKLKEKVDALIVVPNDRIFSIISKDTPIIKAFEAIDEVLRNALNGLVEIVAQPGIINVDFADVKNIVQDAGIAVVGVGVATGADRATNAVNMALHSPLLETSPEGAHAVLLGISGGHDLKMNEVNDIAKVVAQTADPGAKIIFGAYYDKNLKQNQIKVTLIATGFNGSGQASSLFGGGRYEQSIFTRPSVNNSPSFGSQVSSQSQNREKEDSFEKKNQREDLSSKKNDNNKYFDDLKNSSNISQKVSGFLNKDVNSQKFPKKDEKKDKEEIEEIDPWDIPAFLRRRKK